MSDDRDGERHGVDRVRDVRAGDGAEDRADHPAEVLDGLEERVRLRQERVVDEVRHARVDRRPEEAGRESRDERKRDDGARARRERQRHEHADADRVRRDHQRAPRQPVEERPEEQPDDDRRQELDDEHRTDPETGVRRVLRPLLNVERQRDGGHERADARAERGEEKPAERRQPERLELGGEGAQPSLDANTLRRNLRDARKDVSKRDSEELVLLRRADADADRLRRAEAVERPDDDAFALQSLEERCARRRRRRRGSCRAPARPARGRARGGSRRAARGRLALSSLPPRELLRLVEARERRRLRRRGHVKRAPHLRGRRHDVGRRDRPPDPHSREAVDLRERPQHGEPPALAEQLDAVGVVRVVDVLEVRLVEDAEDVLRQPVEERDELVARRSRCRSGCSGGRRRRASSAARSPSSIASRSYVWSRSGTRRASAPSFAASRT